jgi:flagellar biogenesis protein FliO
MDFLNFLSGNGLFLILALVLVVIYVVNRIKKR